MNKSTTLALRLLLISSAALGYTPAICGQNSTTWIQIQQNAISDRLVTIGIWEHDAQLQVNLIIAVIVFGAMVGYCKPTTALGANWQPSFSVPLSA